MQAQTLELTLPPEPGSVAEARSRVLDAVGPDLGDDGQVETLRLLVSELVTNAVRHGDHDHPVEIHAMWNAEIRVEVIDHGHGFSPAPRAGELDEPGGFGLFLVGRLADRWGVETDTATRVWFVLRRA
jgi:anti-sigma regulatory factor (Ser/Thr protein kinase)